MDNIINARILKNNIKKSLLELEKPIDCYEKYNLYEKLSKAYLYLNDLKQFEFNIEQSINHLSVCIETRNSDDLYNIYRLKYKKAYLMSLNQEDITNISNDIIQYNMDCINNAYSTKENYHNLAHIYFLLGNYEKCISYYKKMNNFGIEPYLYNIALAILNKDTKSLETIKNNIIKYFSKKIAIGTEICCFIGVWDYYEICLKYLGLPNKIDDIYNYKYGIIKNHVEIKEPLQDISIQEWCITLIQTVEVSSEIFMNKNFFRIKDLKSIQKLIEPTQFKIIMDNTVEKKVELNTNDWKISSIIEKYNPKIDITDIQSKELYLKDIFVGGNKKSYVETNQAIDCCHKIIIKSNQKQAEELSAILSNEFFSKYDELETVINLIKDKISPTIEFIKVIPYTNFDIEYITLIYVQ